MKTGPSILPVAGTPALAYQSTARARITKRMLGDRLVEGETLVVDIDGDTYAEYPQADELPISDAAAKWERHPWEYPINCQHPQILAEMEALAGFNFYPKQKGYLLRVAATTGALVAAETGVGKTVLGLGLIRLAAQSRSLILAPQSVVRSTGEDLAHWEAEIRRFLPGVDVHRLLCADDYADREMDDWPDGIYLSYHHAFLLNDGGLARKCGDQFGCIVVDEAHLVMNPESIMAQELYRLQPAYRYALTATPITNRVHDIVPLCQWLNFQPDFALPYQQETFDGQPVESINVLSPLLFRKALAHVVAPIRKVDINPALPPCFMDVRHIEPTPETADELARIEAWQPARQVGAGQIRRIKMARSRQVCADDRNKSAALISDAISVVHSGQQVVVVCARISQSNFIASIFEAAGVRFARIDSTTSAKKHSSMAAAFKRGDIEAMILGIKCAYGHSFDRCQNILVGSLEWDRGTANQAVGRCYRVTTKLPVFARFYCLRGTIDGRQLNDVCLKEHAANDALYGERGQSTTWLTSSGDITESEISAHQMANRC